MISYFGQPCQKKEIRNFVSIFRLTGKCAAQKLKKPFAVLVYVHVSMYIYLVYVHHMVILRSQNNITDVFMILAWVSPFNP